MVASVLEVLSELLIPILGVALCLLGDLCLLVGIILFECVAGLLETISPTSGALKQSSSGETEGSDASGPEGRRAGGE